MHALIMFCVQFFLVSFYTVPELLLTFLIASNNQFCRVEIKTETFKVVDAFVLMMASLDRAWS